MWVIDCLRIDKVQEVIGIDLTEMGGISPVDYAKIKKLLDRKLNEEEQELEFQVRVKLHQLQELFDRQNKLAAQGKGKIQEEKEECQELKHKV